MKKFIAIALAAFSMTCAASVQTNWVYVVSNIYNNVYSESVITQKVKNTHFNYYYTNHIYTVSNIVVEVSRTNLHLNVVWDNFGPWVNAASNSALQAAASVSNAQDYAGSAAQYATTAGNSASLANGAVSLAQAYASQSESAAANGLAAINSRIAWFDEWASNKVITVVHTNISILVNAQDYSYIYTNTAGTAFNYVRVHPYGANGGATISARGAMAYSTIGIRAWPLPRVSGYWDFYPAYIDTDENGMRLQYVPDTTIPIQYGDSSSAYPNGKTVPEYFYWQSGYIYMKVRVWQNGSVVAWCLTCYKWDNWPSTIGYGGDTGTAMSLVNRYQYGPSSGTFGYFHSLTRTASQNTAIEFPMSPSPSLNPVLEWMRNGPSE